MMIKKDNLKLGLVALWVLVIVVVVWLWPKNDPKNILTAPPVSDNLPSGEPIEGGVSVEELQGGSLDFGADVNVQGGGKVQ